MNTIVTRVAMLAATAIITSTETTEIIVLDPYPRAHAHAHPHSHGQTHRHCCRHNMHNHIVLLSYNVKNILHVFKSDRIYINSYSICATANVVAASICTTTLSYGHIMSKSNMKLCSDAYEP